MRARRRDRPAAERFPRDHSKRRAARFLAARHPAGRAAAGLLPAGGPFPTLASVPNVAIDTSKPRESAVAKWSERDLGVEPSGVFQATTTPGTVRGVLVTRGSRYIFVGSSGTSSTAYFVSKGDGENFMKAWQRRALDGTFLFPNVAAYGPGAQIARVKLTRSLHLVDAEINDGRGDATNDGSLVISHLRVLDGTAVLPVNLEAARTTLGARARAVFEKARPKRDALVRAAVARLPATDRKAGTPSTDETFDVAWDDAHKDLSFTYVHRDTTTYAGPERVLPSNCPLGQPCQAQIERPQHAVTVLVAVRQKLSATGALVEEITYEPRVRVLDRR